MLPDASDSGKREARVTLLYVCCICWTIHFFSAAFAFAANAAMVPALGLLRAGWLGCAISFGGAGGGAGEPAGAAVGDPGGDLGGGPSGAPAFT